MDYFILSQLKEHMGKDTGMVENRKCYVCGKAFSTEHHFELHMRLHNNEKPCEKPHVCNVCNKSFTQSRHRGDSTRSLKRTHAD